MNILKKRNLKKIRFFCSIFIKKSNPPVFWVLELCHAWEDAAKLSDDSKTKQITIRSGVVLGRTGGMIAQTFWPFFFGLGGPLGSGEQYMPWIHIEDLVYMFIHALENNVHPVLNGVAPQVIISLGMSFSMIKITIAMKKIIFFHNFN